MTIRRRTVLGAAALSAPAIRSAAAQGRRETLLLISENPPNSTDIHGVGANRPAYEASWNLYDRLMTFGVKKDANGNDHYDHQSLKPELAEDWEVGPMSATFRLRRDAKFQDGTPVTAQDVKWSFDRAVTVGGFPHLPDGRGQPGEARTVRRRGRAHLPRGLPPPRQADHAGPRRAGAGRHQQRPGQAQRHAAGPWAMDWLRSNPAGSGAFRLERWVPGQEMVFARNDAWTQGPRPALARVIWRIVPQAGNRRALLERGDADISFDLPPKDFAEMQQARRLRVVSTPVENALQYVGMNCARPPFDNAKVRQAVAYAVPYQRIMEQAVYGQAAPMFGGPARPETAMWPQPSPFTTDLDRARALLAEAGHPNGFETTLSFNLGLATVNEPVALALAENLGRIGIRTTINKVPGANWRNELLKKEMPLITNNFGGWLNFPDYFFFWGYHGQNAVFNTMSYRDPAMDALIDRSRFAQPRRPTRRP
jgi:peptide/nickel transport system substrate-binding protein